MSILIHHVPNAGILSPLTGNRCRLWFAWRNLKDCISSSQPVPLTSVTKKDWCGDCGEIINTRERCVMTVTTTTNFINKQILILQKHCPQLARQFEAGQCVQNMKLRLRLTEKSLLLVFFPSFLSARQSWKIVRRFSRNVVISRDWSRTRPTTSAISVPVSSSLIYIYHRETLLFLKNPRILFSHENIHFFPLQRGFSKDSDVDVSSPWIPFIPKQYSSSIVYMLSLSSISTSYTVKQLTHLSKVRLLLALISKCNYCFNVMHQPQFLFLF